MAKIVGAIGSDSLEQDAAAVLDPVLDAFVVSMAAAEANLPSMPNSSERRAAAVEAISLAKWARSADDINTKLATTIAAGYSASFFGLPQNHLLATVDRVCGMFAMTANQRRALHQQAAALCLSYGISLKKGNAMSGILQNGSYRDGSLGVLVSQQRAVRDGVLGALMAQPVAYQDGSLGIAPPAQYAYRDGSLGADRRMAVLPGHRPMHRPIPHVTTNLRRAISGLGGCGCAGVGADGATETPFYKKPLVIGGVAVAVGVVWYALARK